MGLKSLANLFRRWSFEDAGKSFHVLFLNCSRDEFNPFLKHKKLFIVNTARTFTSLTHFWRASFLNRQHVLLKNRKHFLLQYQKSASIQNISHNSRHTVFLCIINAMHNFSTVLVILSPYYSIKTVLYIFKQFSPIWNLQRNFDGTINWRVFWRFDFSQQPNWR
jgi:hypothetical protein